MNELVKYHNDMNTINFNTFNAVELDLLFSICSKIRDEGLNTITYDFLQLRSLSKYKPTANKRFIDDLQRVNRKLLALNFTITTDIEVIQFVLFKTFKTNLKNQTLTISVNEEFSYILNELTANFTRFELNEFITLESKYAKNLYRLLKQYRSTGKVYFSINDFRNKLDVPKSYQMRDINKKVLSPIEKELKLLFSEFRIEKVKDLKRRGQPVTHINFFFAPQKSLQSAQNESLDTLRKVYLPDFTLEEIKTLLRHGSQEDLKRASKAYKYYKESDQPIHNKMGFIVSLLPQTNNFSESTDNIDSEKSYENLFTRF